MLSNELRSLPPYGKLLIATMGIGLFGFMLMLTCFSLGAAHGSAERLLASESLAEASKQLVLIGIYAAWAVVMPLFAGLLSREICLEQRQRCLTNQPQMEPVAPIIDGGSPAMAAFSFAISHFAILIL